MESNKETFRVRPMGPTDLGCVLEWRNHPDVRKYMFSRQRFEMDEHRRWFESASSDAKKHLMIFESSSQRLGFVQFTELSYGEVADWGFYLDPEAAAGTGRELASNALRFAFRDIGLHKVCGQALAFNERSIKFHTAVGFTHEGTLREQYFDGEDRHDVLCFGLLSAEWTEMQSTRVKN